MQKVEFAFVEKDVYVNHYKRKRIILKKTDGLCAKCGKPLTLEKTTIDHLVPKYRGGTDELSNLIPMCKHCNKQKGSRIVEEEELAYLEPF